jgi:hypothetical protein
MMLYSAKNLKTFMNIIFPGFLLLLIGLTDFNQFTGLLFFYLVITFGQVTTHTTSSQYFNPITLAGFVLLTFNFQLANTERIWILLAIIGIFFLIYREQINLVDLNLSIPNLSLLIMLIAVRLLQNVKDWLLQFLGFGYDNAFHLTVFRGYRLTSWFPDPKENSWWTDFNLFQVTPTGSSALFSTFSNVLIGENHDPYLETASFFVIQICMLVALISISMASIIRYYPKKYDKKYVLIIATLLVLLIVYSTGTMSVNGFPPYVAVTLVLAYWMKMQPLLTSSSTRLFNLTFAAFVVLLITPGPFAFLIIPGLYLTAMLFSDFIANRDFKAFFIGVAAPLVLGGISYIEFRSTSGSFGWRQILAPGGVHRPSLFLTIFITVIFFLFSIKRKSDFLVWLLILSGFFSTAFLSAVTIIYTGSVQYYAVKQLYVWLPLTGIFIVSQIWKTKFVLENGRFVSVAAVLGFFLVSSTFWSNSSSSGWMGNPSSAIRNVANQSIWNQSVIHSKNFLSLLEEETSVPPACIIMRLNPSESDLNSRWANALTKPLTMSSKCFDGYWNSSSLSTINLLNRIRNLQENYLLLLPLDAKESISELSLPDNVVIRFG